MTLSRRSVRTLFRRIARQPLRGHLRVEVPVKRVSPFDRHRFTAPLPRLRRNRYERTKPVWWWWFGPRNRISRTLLYVDVALCSTIFSWCDMRRLAVVSMG